MRKHLTMAILCTTCWAAHSNPASFLGAPCGATAQKLEASEATLIDNTEENRGRLGAELDPFYSVSAIGHAGLETKLALRLPIFPSEFRFAELLFRDGQLARMSVFFKISDDTTKAQNALVLMRRIDQELLTKYALIRRIEHTELPPFGLLKREHWRYDGDAGIIRIGYVFRDIAPSPKTEVMARIDFSEKCSQR